MRRLVRRANQEKIGTVEKWEIIYIDILVKKYSGSFEKMLMLEVWKGII